MGAAYVVCVVFLFSWKEPYVKVMHCAGARVDITGSLKRIFFVCILIL